MDTPPTKRNGLPRLTRIMIALMEPIEVRSLAVFTMVSSLLCGVAYYCVSRVSEDLQRWCEFWLFVGPGFCLLLSGMLLIAFFRSGRRHALMFVIGMAFGLIPYSLLLYHVTHPEIHETEIHMQTSQ